MVLQVESPLQILAANSIYGCRRIERCGKLGLVEVPAGVIWPRAR